MYLSDQELAERFAAGDRSAFNTLVLRHKDRVYRFVLCQGVRGADAEDLAQEAFIQVFGSIGRFRGEASFVTWLYALTRNVCRNHARKSKEPGVPVEEDGRYLEIPDGCPPLDEGLARGERSRAIHEALASLPAIHREALVLKDIDGLSYREIAEILDVPLGTVRSRIHNATAALLTVLERQRILEAENELPRSE